MRKVTIGLQGFSERSASILTVFLSRHLKFDYALIEGKGDLNILDLDCVNSKQLWEDHNRAERVLPLIVVSVHKKDLPNVIWLQKPLNVERLTEVIGKIVAEHRLQQLEIHTQKERAEAKEQSIEAARKELGLKEKSHPKIDISEQRVYVSQSLQGYNKNYSNPDLLPSISGLNEDRRTVRWFYGSRDDEIYRADFDSPELYYDPDHYLQGAYTRALKSAENNDLINQLIAGGVHLLITDKGNTTYSNKNNSFLHQVCFIRTIGETFTLKPLKKPHLLEQQKHQMIAHNSHSFLWNLSLWSSRGRLPEGVSGDTLIWLTRWPNFTRLDIPPYAMRIVALWFNIPTTINATSNKLNVPFCAVYSVFSACYALGLVKQLSPNELKQQDAVKKVSLPRQFFRALIKKLS